MSDTGDRDLPGGISADRAAEFAALVAEICDRETPGHPWLAPALLFGDPSVRALVGLPEAPPGAMLVQDYLSISGDRLRPGRPLRATARRETNGPTTEVHVGLSDGRARVDMVVAVRVVPVQDLRATKVVRLRAPEGGETSGPVRHLTVSQGQIDRYTALSGDLNPIHRDRGLAADLGLDAPIVPGLLLVALLQPLAPGRDLAALRARFMAPLTAGSAFTIALQPTGAERVRARVFDGGERGLALADLTMRG